MILNFGIGRLVPKLAKPLVTRTDSAGPGGKLGALRRMETILSIASAGLKVVVVGVALYYAWRVTHPTSAPVALIGASALAVVLANSILGSLLKDLTSGAVMLAEGWYNVGDHVVIEPFASAGVVDQLTLRSTKLRSISGEIIWIHNQFIQGVRITPQSVKTMTVDAFVSDPARGRALFEGAIQTLPMGPTMLAAPLVVEDAEQVGDALWRITAVGQTAPGREWLIEDYAVNTIRESDDLDNPALVHGPIVRYTDAAAERRFRRSVRVKKPVKRTVAPKSHN